MKNHPSARESEEESTPAGPIEHRPQEIPLTSRDSRFRFDPFEKQFVATRGAVESFGIPLIHDCLTKVREKADFCDGLDYLQVFLIGPEKRKLWLIEDGQAITALLPDEY